MTYEPTSIPVGPNPPRAKPEDLAATVSLLVISVLAAFFGAIMLLFSVAFIDHCPPETCSLDAAWLSMNAGQAFMLLSLVVGIALSIWRLVKRKIAWRIALTTLVAVILSAVLGFVAVVISAGMY